MEEKIKNIKASVIIEKQSELQYSVIGERIEDYEKYFNDVFYKNIQDNVKHSNWGVWFQQSDESKPSFIVDIYVDDQNDYILIRRVIEYFKQSDPELIVMPPNWDYQKFVGSVE